MAAEISRRSFLVRTAGAASVGYLLAGARPADAFPLALPIGVQSFDLTPKLKEDLRGTLKELAADGYQWIDWLAASRTNVPEVAAMSAKEAHALFASFGLSTPNISATLDDLTTGYDKTIQIVHDFEATSVVCTPSGAVRTLDEWKQRADQLNAVGERTRKDGVLTGYHNGRGEFTDIDGVTPYDVLAKTDPTLVKFMFDIGTCQQAGKDPAAYLRKYPDHFFSMHAKDEKDGRLGLAVGEGNVDWKAVFTAAKAAKLRHYAVETAADAATVMARSKQSIDYLRAMPPV